MSQPAEEMPPTYLIQVVVALLLCPPVGWAAVVAALRTRARLERGDREGARAESARACAWCWLSFAGWVAGLMVVLAIWRLMSVG